MEEFTRCLKVKLPEDVVTYTTSFIPPKISLESVYQVVEEGAEKQKTMNEISKISEALKAQCLKKLKENPEKFRAFDVTESSGELVQMVLDHCYQARHDSICRLHQMSANNRRSNQVWNLCRQINQLNRQIDDIEFNKYCSYDLLEELSTVVPLTNFGNIDDNFWQRSFAWVLFA